MFMKYITCLSFLFFLSELILMITRRSGKKGRKMKKDRMSLILFWIAITCGLTIGFIKANRDDWGSFNHLLAIICISIFSTGIIIRWAAIFQLKKEFTVDVAISEKHNLNTSGLYHYIRHPSYLGLLLICLGLSLAMNSLVSLAVIIVPLFLVTVYRIRIEEKLLLDEFGDTYKNYMLKTKRIFPGIY